MKTYLEISLKRASTSAEIEECRILINQVFHEKQRVGRKDRDAITKEDAVHELCGKTKQLFMLSENGSNSLLGTALLTFDHIKKYGLCGVIQYLAIDSKFRGQGFGADLLLRLEKLAQGSSCKYTYLTIIDHPFEPQARLVKWYKDLGYQFIEKKFFSEEMKLKWFSQEYCREITVDYYVKALE